MARVIVDNIKGKEVLFSHGVPQGGANSPTMILIFIDDRNVELPNSTNAALYIYIYIYTYDRV